MLRDNLVGLIEPMRIQKQASDDRPSCLENPRPDGAESSLTENVTSPFQAEPAQRPRQALTCRVGGIVASNHAAAIKANIRTNCFPMARWLKLVRRLMENWNVYPEAAHLP